jgi:hypothetical protein
VPQGNGNGFLAYYYTQQKTTFNGGITLARRDSKIDFNWGGGSPDPSISIDNFTAKWFGSITPQFTDTYTFYITGDDGVRLTIDGNLLINKWIAQDAVESTATINLEVGRSYPIQVDYYEEAGNAIVKLAWSSTLLPKQTIPASQVQSDAITDLQMEMAPSLQIFPNPVEDRITVQSKSSWIIYNTFGQKIHESENEPFEQLSIATNQWLAGIYIIKTTDGQSLRFIKK